MVNVQNLSAKASYRLGIRIQHKNTLPQIKQDSIPEALKGL